MPPVQPVHGLETINAAIFENRDYRSEGDCVNGQKGLAIFHVWGYRLLPQVDQFPDPTRVHHGAPDASGFCEF
jgi:hypothetical protein